MIAKQIMLSMLYIFFVSGSALYAMDDPDSNKLRQPLLSPQRPTVSTYSTIATPAPTQHEELPSALDRPDITKLMRAAYNGNHTPFTNKKIQKNILYKTDTDGNTVLHWAIKSKSMRDKALTINALLTCAGNSLAKAEFDAFLAMKNNENKTAWNILSDFFAQVPFDSKNPQTEHNPMMCWSISENNFINKDRFFDALNKPCYYDIIAWALTRNYENRVKSLLNYKNLDPHQKTFSGKMIYDFAQSEKLRNLIIDKSHEAGGITLAMIHAYNAEVSLIIKYFAPGLLQKQNLTQKDNAGNTLFHYVAMAPPTNEGARLMTLLFNYTFHCLEPIEYYALLEAKNKDGISFLDIIINHYKKLGFNPSNEKSLLLFKYFHALFKENRFYWPEILANLLSWSIYTKNLQILAPWIMQNQNFNLSKLDDQKKSPLSYIKDPEAAQLFTQEIEKINQKLLSYFPQNTEAKLLPEKEDLSKRTNVTPLMKAAQMLNEPYFESSTDSSATLMALDSQQENALWYTLRNNIDPKQLSFLNRLIDFAQQKLNASSLNGFLDQKNKSDETILDLLDKKRSAIPNDFTHQSFNNYCELIWTLLNRVQRIHASGLPDLMSWAIRHKKQSIIKRIGQLREYNPRALNSAHSHPFTYTDQETAPLLLAIMNKKVHEWKALIPKNISQQTDTPSTSTSNQ